MMKLQRNKKKIGDDRSINRQRDLKVSREQERCKLERSNEKA